LLRREAEIAERSGRYVQSLRLLGKAQRSLDSVDGADAARERARLAIWYASGRMRQGRHREAVRWCRRALEIAEPVGDRETLAWAYMVLDSVSAELGLETDVPYGRLALSIYEELGDLPRQATMTLNLGGRAYYEGNWQEALARFEGARGLYTRTGNTVGAADATFNIGEIMCHQGRLEEGATLVREAGRVWRAAGDRIGVDLATSELARVAYRKGDCEEALPLLERVRSDFQTAGAEGEAWETDVRIAECLLLLRQDGTAALAILDRILEHVRASGEVASVRIPRVQRLRAWALAQQHRLEEAGASLEECVRTARQDGSDYELALALDGLARMASRTERDRAELFERESSEILARLGVVAAPGVPAFDLANE
jgi:tetratricopeptide (TPR) repeat protein